ncbi:MAG: penicillin-insensitive murein endopeptidase [Bdellovibrionota bacterium]
MLGNSWAGPRSTYHPEFPPCSPATEFSDGPLPDEPAPQFCAAWNPEYAYNGHHCCSRFIHSHRKSANKCAPQRLKSNYCDEMTEDQRAYKQAVLTGKVPDVLVQISQSMGIHGEQAFCTVNNGFLVYGRPLVPTAANRIQLRTPTRCLDTGTDGMVGMLEWVGHQISHEYSTPEYSHGHFLIGDISAPRGGCLWGRSGRRGHASHTSGQDVDVGYLTMEPHHESPPNFHTHFDAKQNWWMVKQIFKNPFACVKVIFLDHRWIYKLKRQAEKENDLESWQAYRQFIRHMPGHRNHMHVRIGDVPGVPGCSPDARPDLEEEDDSGEGIEAILNDSLKTSQGADVEK